jgi:hypothetical protein
MPEDRDQLFEKALARHLRAEAGESLCLDPETLASYHERMLSPEELAFAKSHIVSCARCQEILAQLEATQEVNALQEATEAVPAVGVITATAGARGQTELGSMESAKTATSSKKAGAIPIKKYSSLRWAAPAGAIAAALLIWIGVRESNKRMSRGPSAQVAENRRQAPPQSAATDKSDEFVLPKDLEKQKSEAFSVDQLKEKTRDSRTTPAAPPSLFDEKDNLAVAGKLAEERKKPSAGYEYSPRTGTRIGGGRGPSAAAAQAQANNALQRGDQAVIAGAAPMLEATPAPRDLDKAEPQKAQPAQAAKSVVSGFAGQPAAAPSPRPVRERAPGRLRGTITDPAGGVIAGANVVLKSAEGGTVASTSTDSIGTYSFSNVAEGNYQLELHSAGFKTDVLTGLNVTGGENVMNARLEIGAATETVQVVAQAPVLNSQATEVAEVRSAPAVASNFRDLVLISPGLQTATSPDGKAVWKFGEAGRIFHSTNAGKDWTLSASGVTVKLLAGSAPSAKVCWIAGAAGTLLRTTNGGKHWQKIAVPISGDLGGVHASDDKNAAIWDAANRLHYETSDSGKTWKQSANE